MSENSRIEMKELRQCCALLEQHKRCSKTSIGSSDHCQSHRQIAKPLYIQYKKLHDQIDRFRLNTANEYNLMKYYSLLSQTYEARRKHRNMAYVPECYDYG